jgi:hypothetical protein
MGSYTNTFGGSAVQPADVSYRAVTLSTNTTLSWPDSNESTTDIVTRIMAVSATTGNLTITMPPASQVSKGRDALIRNTGASTFGVLDAGGGVIANIAAGQAYYIYITNNSSSAGSWAAIIFGTGTSSADASALAGAGLFVSGGTLNQSTNVSSKNADYMLLAGDRAGTFINTGGSITFSFDPAATLGSNWFVHAKNRGSGTLTLDPSGGETIDGSSTLSLASNESCIIVCDGTALYTIGYGRSLAQTAFTRLVKALTTSSVTLTSTEAGNVVQEYTGTLSSNTRVIVPTTVARYYAYNNTTASGYTLTVTTASGVGVTVNAGTRKIVHCDGTNIVNSIDAGAGTVTNIATGSGLTGGPITSTGTIAIATTAVSSGSYIQGNFTVGTDGRLTAASNGVVTENAQTTDYTFVLGDAFKFVTMNSASSRTFTIPASGSVNFPIGTMIPLGSRGAGDVSVTGGGSVTINSEGGKYKLYGQYAMAGLLKTGTNEWFFGGNRKN